jgi:hypothetical protein
MKIENLPSAVQYWLVVAVLRHANDERLETCKNNHRCSKHLILLFMDQLVEAPNSAFVCAKQIIGKTIEIRIIIGMTRRPTFSAAQFGGTYEI